MDQNELKKAAGIRSVDFIKDGMTVGLGTGSTVFFMVEELGRRVQEEGLNVQCVTTSDRTWDQAVNLGIKMLDVNDVDHIDITIDGADEIDDNYQGIKGGGAAHLKEKIVALNSKQVVWIVDQSKIVHTLGKFPLPTEVIPFGSQKTFDLLEKEGLSPKFRTDDQGELVKTDSNNLVIDLYLNEIKHPHLLAKYLDGITGIVEHGLFLDMVNTVVIGNEQAPKVIENIR
ncbi:ribose-5-phosphate isomerase RpiA [Lactobacillus sp. YT155]|uniref:ribose-5-phosphate isomerase RpiA n=1 Tax=Lactobacillus sp. YT155 TaxID=3060955 RepID=UPI00265F06F1|nr:ribose-5-phosphate isomerase RpiA [Lactobacillus sp. YT155]MDO1604462.1 ribose-5-phosphate isomerase RpiA [Lactobacillus sp. YT155]